VVIYYDFIDNDMYFSGKIIKYMHDIVCYTKPIHTCHRIMTPKVNAVNATLQEKKLQNKIFFTFTEHLKNLLCSLFAIQ